MKSTLNCIVVSVAALVLVATFETEARAQYITPGTEGYQGVERGVFDLGFENVLLVRYQSDVAGSGLEAAYIGGLAPRYFLARNFALGLSLNFFYGTARHSDELASGSVVESRYTDIAFIGFITANYYVRIAGGLFFKPGLGIGGLAGRREVPNPDVAGTYTGMSLYGGTGKLDLGFIFYANGHFNLRASLEILFLAGAAEAEGVSDSFFAIDAGFNVGVGYSF